MTQTEAQTEEHWHRIARKWAHWTAPRIAVEADIHIPTVYHHWRAYRHLMKAKKPPRAFAESGVLLPHEAAELMAYIATKKRRKSKTLS